MTSRAPLRAITAATRWIFAALAALAMALPVYAQTYSSQCSGCHGASISGGRVNAADSVSVINVANTVNGMGTNSANWAAVAADIGNLVTESSSTTVNYGSTGNVITIPAILVAGSSVLNTLEYVSGPSVTITAGSNSVSYNHTAGNCSTQTLVVRGRGNPVAATGGTVTPITSNRTVTININPPPAPTASNSTSSIGYSTSATAIPLTIGGGPAASVSVSALSPNVGSLNVSGTSVTYTASATSYASTVQFTYQAIGTCGATSSTATVTINVGAPPPPTVSNKSQTVLANTTTGIDLSANISGLYSSIAIASGPSNGTATVSGTTVNYTPNTNYSGPDSFTYTASGPGGPSAPATVSITVSAAPLTSNHSVSTPYQTAIAINLASSITGTFTSVSVASPPSRGTAVVTGPSTITYTPAAGYSGPDSFTYTASGPGGSSTPATVSITVGPPAPTASNFSVSVPSGSSTLINMSPGISGVFTSVSVASPPARGTAVVTSSSGITYTPNAGYIGGDTFTYTATGPGGTSSPATVTITVAPPPAPLAAPTTLAVPHNTPATIDVAAFVSGVYSSIFIAGNPAHGTLTLDGTRVTYTPAAGYYGQDSFTYVAIGPGSNSRPATVVITVAPPNAPTASAQAVTVPFNTAVTINLATSVVGVFTSVTIATGPSHGSVALAGTTATYRPTNGYTGPDSFTYTATGPGGTSPPATVSLTVATAPPVASATTLSVALNGSVTTDLAPFISGSGITGIAIGRAPANGSAEVNGTKVTYRPRPGFFGNDSFTYVAFGNAGTSPPATVTVTVLGRPDPTREPNVVGAVGAHASTTTRFARAQIANFQRRLESLHDRAPEPAASAERAGEREPVARREAPPVQLASAGNASGLGAMPAATTNALASALANSFLSLAASQSLGVNATTAHPTTNVWIAGNLRFGHRDPVHGSERVRFTSDGVSAGADRRFGRAALGIGLGFSRDKTDIGTDGSKTEGDGTAFALYGSFQPSARTFVDALAGYATLDLDSDRFVGTVGDFARSSRKGEQWFASLAAGYEYRREGLLVSPYARLDYATTRLKQATERGAGANALTYFEQTVPMFQGTLGVRAESQHETRFGAVRPRARVELSRDFEGDRAAVISYADDFGTRYSVTPTGVKRNALLLGIGSDFLLGGGLSLGLDYSARRTSRADIDQGIRLQITQELGARGVPRWFGASSMFEDPVRVEAGYVYDDNVTRARVARDKLADHIFSVSASKGRVFPIATNTRVVGSLFVSAEELYRYTGLGRVSGGVQAEFQYRPSGDFDAMTFGVLGRVAGDYYDISIRRGHRYTLALTARQSLTDRIEAFAAITGSARYARSAVFDAREYGARFNLDYALGGPSGSLYAAGEYRRGDAVSSGRFSLENIDIAEVFTPDDAFGPGFFSYRFDAKTWIGTLGYNRPLGPRDAIDFSYRRVQSYPSDKPSWAVPGPWRYIDNQYSIIYLMRF